MLSYGEMLDRMAGELGRRRAADVPVPLLTPRLSSLWIGLVTPVDAGVARPLVGGPRHGDHGRRSVRRRLFDVEPRPFAETVRSGLRERDAPARAASREPPPRATSSSAASVSSLPAGAGVRVLRRRAQPRGDHAAVAAASASITPGPIDDARRHADRLPAPAPRRAGPVAHADRRLGAAAALRRRPAERAVRALGAHPRVRAGRRAARS